MFLMQLTRIDFPSIFEQGFRLIVLMIMLVNYIMLFFMHFFMVRPLYGLCGHEHFSIVTRWLFIAKSPSNVSSAYWEVKAICYTTNVLDITVLGFALMFIVSAAIESLLSYRTTSKLNRLEDSNEPGLTMGKGLLHQRIIRKDAFRRLIFRMTISLMTGMFATANFASIFTVFILHHLVAYTLSEAVREKHKTALSALKWQIMMYLFLSCFFCGLVWSVWGIYKSQLQLMSNRSKRVDQFKKMNANETKSLLVNSD